MKNRISLAVFVAIFCWASLELPSLAKELNVDAQLLQKRTSSNQIPSSLLSQAKCIAVMQTIPDRFDRGGEHGGGAVSCRTALDGSAPALAP